MHIYNAIMDSTLKNVPNYIIFWIKTNKNCGVSFYFKQGRVNCLLLLLSLRRIVFCVFICGAKTGVLKSFPFQKYLLL